MPRAAAPLPVALLVLPLLPLLLGGCASTRTLPDGSVRYTYSTFDFSGDAWKAQQQRCAADGKKPQDLGTDCGFWTCTSRLACQ